MGGSEVVRRKVHALLLCCTRAYKETGSVGMICIWNFTVGKKKKKKALCKIISTLEHFEHVLK